MQEHASMITRLSLCLICIQFAATSCVPAPVASTPSVPTPKIPTPSAPAPAVLPTQPPSATLALSPAASLPTPIAAGMNEPFTLQMSQAAILPDANHTRVTFTNLVEDSRCLSDANCIQVGRARVAIFVESAGRLARFDLSTNRADLNAVGAFSGNLVELIEVMPLPRAGAAIPPGDYRVTLRVKPGALDHAFARFNEPFALKLGQSVGFEDSSMRLTFESVQQDSRCPTRVLCATSGMAVLGVAASNGGANETYAVQVGGSEVITSFPVIRTVSVRIRANALTPYPQQEFASKEFSLTEYQATFVVVNPATPLVAPTPR